MKVCLDPGHGGKDRANRGPSGYIEADGVLDIALRVKELLVKKGIEVVITRDKDETVSLAKRVAIADGNKADILVSIHSNAGPPQARGVETFYSAFSKQGKALAKEIQIRLVGLGLKDRGIKIRLGKNGADYYYMIRNPKAVSVITEVGFHTNPEEEKLLKTASFRQKAAQAIANGIIAFSR
ncbi:MAG TPA: N-acetylmuramoyl-L-alanine amidase [Clostridia bacterium]|jgi:N-acetylmuramoyl-L-alanine amidase|nr:N-acetylmuramoyl-L-alanine amidase [Clostridia bacterium]